MTLNNQSNDSELRQRLKDLGVYDNGSYNSIDDNAVNQVIKFIQDEILKARIEVLRGLIKTQRKYIGLASFTAAPKSQGEKDEAERTLTWLEDMFDLQSQLTKSPKEGEANERNTM